MRNYLLFVFSFILILILSPNLSAQTDSVKKPEYYKVSEVRIFINDKSDVTELRKQGLGFEHIKMQDNYFDVLLDSVQIDKLKKSVYPYEIIIDDVTKDYLERTKESREIIKLKKPSQSSGFGYGSMGGFYTFSEVVAQLDIMRLLYPNLITVKDSIGATIEGRAIWAVKISDNPDVNENEPQIFYNSLIHAREPEGMMAVIYFMYYLLESYGTDPEVTYLVDNREFYFVPVINPDGYVYNQSISANGGGMWRKNLRNNGNGIFGVDLNRNFGYMWGYDDIGSSPDPSATEYRGTGPFSEPEIQAIRDFCNSHNFLICNNYHSFANSISSPWEYNSSQTPDSTIFISTLGLSSQLNGYNNWLDLPTSYETNGSVNDWMYGEQTTKSKIFSYLTEVGNNYDGFWPVPNRIFPIAEENCYLNKVLAWGPQVIENPPYISDATLNTNYCRPLLDTIKINAIESNPDNHTSTVTAKVLTFDNILLDEIQLNKIGSSFSGSLVVNSTNEEFYNIELQQNGIDIPSKFFYDNLRFTTTGPVVVDSFTVTRIDSNRIFIHNIFFTNKSSSATVTSLSAKAKNVDGCATTNDGQKLLANLNANTTIKMAGGYFFDISECASDSIELAIEIFSGDTKYWESKFWVKIPSLFGTNDLTLAMNDEANEITNWSSVGWGITTEKYVSAPSSFTDSPSGNYGTNSAPTLTSKNQIKFLNALYAFLEFDSQWAIQNGWDYGQVQLSTDNGSTWIPLNGQYTDISTGGLYSIQPKGQPVYQGIQSDWVHEIIDISNYKDRQFYLRFLLRSDSEFNMDGWYIDNVKVSFYTTILAEQPYIDKMYAMKNIDSVLFRIRFLDLYNHHFTPHIIYSNADNTDIDSLTLFDDGLHGDSLANDGLYGSYIPPRPTEDFYSLSISTVDHQLNNYIHTPDILRFTTVPLLIDSVQTAEISNFRYTFKPYLKNASTDKTISNITVRLLCSDPWATTIFPAFRICPNLLPGEVKSVPQVFAVTYDSATFPGYFNLKFEIMSNGLTYWYDSKQVVVIVEDEIILSSFDLDSEGWSVNGGNIYYQNSNGNPGGFIEFDDNQDGAGNFIAPSKFLGDLTLYDQGKLKFDLKNTYDNGQDSLYGYGNVRISSSNSYADKNVVPLGYISEWTSFSIPMTADDWGVTQSGWDSLLADVLEIRIQMDAQWNYYDRVGLDNFSLSPNSTDVEPGLFNGIAASYKLNQNYPNPFNSTTKITYQVPEMSLVTLKVYGILGNEIATLINEEKPVGTYDLNWNAANLPSGVYFYRLQAGSFVETKKMILLK